jgi:hypothetical protein
MMTFFHVAMQGARGRSQGLDPRRPLHWRRGLRPATPLEATSRGEREGRTGARVCPSAAWSGDSRGADRFPRERAVSGQYKVLTKSVVSIVTFFFSKIGCILIENQTLYKL